jgi:hypothetical protein
MVFFFLFLAKFSQLGEFFLDFQETPRKKKIGIFLAFSEIKIIKLVTSRTREEV